MPLKKLEIIFLLFVCTSQVVCPKTLNNPHKQKKLQEKVKSERDMQHKKSYRYSSSCDGEIGDWTKIAKIESKLFIISNQNTLASIESISPNLDNCNTGHAEFDMIEIVWRYHFFNSLHCIRVEFELNNSLNKFINATNYKYYSFSYRELGKKNNYTRRQSLNESLNVLTIKRANLRPYIICVNFYKNENIYAPYALPGTFNNSTDNATASEDLSCPEYHDLLHQDDYTHNIDLCVDIDTQAHFLPEIDQGIMVIFLVILLAVMLTSITVANYIIQKPKKRLLLHNLRKYIRQKRRTRTNTPEYSESTLAQSASIGNKLFRPHHLVSSEYSSLDSLDQQQPYFMLYHNYNNNKSSTSDDETDSLLKNNCDKSSQNLQSTLHSVTFQVGETIIEESEDVFDDIEIEMPSEISIKHILDDKPWMLGRVSSTLIATNSRPKFDSDIITKRLNGSSSQD